MPSSLPAYPARAPSLTGVVGGVLDAIDGHDAPFPPVRSAILAVVDGLGTANLAARRGHARFLAPRARPVALSTFPTTTATALTSLLTGTAAGVHGIVGYRADVPGTGVVNQLDGWDAGLIDPLRWQRADPIMAKQAVAGRACFVVSKPEYVASGFTRATLRGADIRGARAIEERVDLALELARSTPGSLTYLYAPELDAAGHRYGSNSEHWAAALERIDGALARLEVGQADGVGVLITADHGMVDVPERGHVLLDSGDPRLQDVRAIAGEPRMLHVYAQPGAAEAVHRAWLREEARCWVFTRESAIRDGLFGPTVSPEVENRIGDVLVAARSAVAFYDVRDGTSAGREMVGQHGSLTAAERVVPLIRAGAFA